MCLRGLLSRSAADEAADEVVAHVAEKGRREEQRGQDGDLEDVGAGQRAARQEQRLAGQKGRHHEPGLGEDRREDGRVGPGTELHDQFGQVDVQVKDVLDHAVERARGATPGGRAAARPRSAPPARARGGR